MTRPVVGWYAHHLGAGHVARALTVAPLVHSRVVVLSSAPRPDTWPAADWVALASDEPSAERPGEDPTAGGALHWAPLAHPGYTARMATLAAWVRAHEPAALVVDVSVEVALLARLLGVPTVVVAMAGDRSDRAHRLGYDTATRIVACWPPDATPVQGWRPEWDAKTARCGAIGRFNGHTPTAPSGRRHVAVLWGRGSARPESDLALARAATPGWTWDLLDTTDPDEVWASLQAADVVVTHAGQNALAEVAAARRPAVVLPQPRPHDEQVCLATALAGRAPVTVCAAWPSPDGWSGLLERTAALDGGAWTWWNDGRGAERFAATVDEVVAR